MADVFGVNSLDGVISIIIAARRALLSGFQTTFVNAVGLE